MVTFGLCLDVGGFRFGGWESGLCSILHRTEEFIHCLVQECSHVSGARYERWALCVVRLDVVDCVEV